MLLKLLSISCCLFSIFVDVRVFRVVLWVRQGRLRPVHILVAHLSIVAIGFALLTILSWAEVSHPGFCRLLYFLSSTLYTTFPLTVACIIRESIGSSSRSSSGNVRIVRMVIFIWMAAGLGALPLFFIVKNEQNPDIRMGTCNPIDLFGKPSVLLVYEMAKYFAINLAVSLFMIYAMFKIHSKINYLYVLGPILNRRLKRKLHKVRIIYLHSVAFILLWLPAWLLVFLQWVCNWELQSSTGLSIILNFILFLMSPLLYVGFVRQISVVQFFLGKSLARRCWWRRQPEAGNSLGTYNEGCIVGNPFGNGITDSELSRVSTLGSITSDPVGKRLATYLRSQSDSEARLDHYHCQQENMLIWMESTV